MSSKAYAMKRRAEEDTYGIKHCLSVQKVKVWLSGWQYVWMINPRMTQVAHNAKNME